MIMVIRVFGFLLNLFEILLKIRVLKIKVHEMMIFFYSLVCLSN